MFLSYIALDALQKAHVSAMLIVSGKCYYALSHYY